jgi:cytochrome bd-type quinol oxidase subunit 2
MNWLGLNWLAILCAGAAYWVLGFVWYSLLFGKMWAAEQERHRGTQPCPSGGMGPKLISTFVANVIAAAAMAYLIKRTGFMDMNHALKLAVATGLGFAGTAVTIISVWESKSTKVWVIDTGFYLLGAILLAVILISWP